MRLGIATNENMRPSEKFVLSPFKNEDEDLKNEVIERACEGVNYYLSHNIKETMNKFNSMKRENE